MSGAGERIKINKQKSWGAVPEELVEDQRLGAVARLVAIWICIRPPGWKIRRDHMLETLGLGLDAWWRARQQLIDYKYLFVTPKREVGRFAGSDLEFFSEPQGADPAPSATAQGFPERGSTVLGSTALGKPRRLTETDKTVEKIKTPPPQKGVVVVSEAALKPAGQPGSSLSELLGVEGVLGGQLDLKSAGATLEQLDYLHTAFHAGVASGNIKDQGAWLVKMAERAAAGQMTGLRQTGTLAAPPVATLAAELLATGIKNGSAILCHTTNKKWVFDEFGGARNGAGVLVGPAATRALLARVAAGELQVNQ